MIQQSGRQHICEIKTVLQTDNVLLMRLDVRCLTVCILSWHVQQTTQFLFVSWSLAWRLLLIRLQRGLRSGKSCVITVIGQFFESQQTHETGFDRSFIVSLNYKTLV